MNDDLQRDEEMAYRHWKKEQYYEYVERWIMYEPLPSPPIEIIDFDLLVTA